MASAETALQHAQSALQAIGNPAQPPRTNDDDVQHDVTLTSIAASAAELATVVKDANLDTMAQTIVDQQLAIAQLTERVQQLEQAGD